MSEPEFKEIEIAVPGGTLHGYEAGPADWPVELVFLHAAGFNARTYRHMLGPLADRARIRALDLRGHGKTNLPLDYERLRNFHIYKNDVIAALEASAEAPVALAGHSLGATATLLLAGERPDLVKSVVALDPPVLPPAIAALSQNTTLRRMFARFIAPYRATSRRRTFFESKAAAVEAYRLKSTFAGWPEQALEDYVEDGFVETEGGVTLACPRDWEARTYLAHKHDVLGAVRRIEAPLWVLLAEQDSPTPPTVEWRIRRFRPEAEVTRLEGRNHMFPLSAPELPRAALEAALDA